jgi:hypothetical protein
MHGMMSVDLPVQYSDVHQHVLDNTLRHGGVGSQVSILELIYAWLCQEQPYAGDWLCLHMCWAAGHYLNNLSQLQQSVLFAQPTWSSSCTTPVFV